MDEGSDGERDSGMKRNKKPASSEERRRQRRRRRRRLRRLRAGQRRRQRSGGDGGGGGEKGGATGEQLFGKAQPAKTSGRSVALDATDRGAQRSACGQFGIFSSHGRTIASECSTTASGELEMASCFPRFSKVTKYTDAISVGPDPDTCTTVLQVHCRGTCSVIRAMRDKTDNAGLGDTAIFRYMANSDTELNAGSTAESERTTELDSCTRMSTLVRIASSSTTYRPTLISGFLDRANRPTPLIQYPAQHDEHNIERHH